MIGGRPSIALALAALVAACGTTDPCGDASTCVVVHIDSFGINAVDQLTLDLVYNGIHGTAVTGTEGDRRALPTTTAVILELTDNRSIQLELLVAGKVAGSVIVGGAKATTVQPGQHGSVAMDLAPVDPCTEGALYCGGFDGILADDHALYRCAGGFLRFAAGCANGCAPHMEQGATCITPGLCAEGGTYCGGDQLPGESGTLYICHDDQGIAPTHCPTACVIEGGGHDFCE